MKKHLFKLMISGLSIIGLNSAIAVYLKNQSIWNLINLLNGILFFIVYYALDKEQRGKKA